MIRRLPVLLSLVAILCGCAKMPPTHYYMLRAEVDADAATPTPEGEGVSVGVRSFQVDAPFDQDRIVYRVGESSPKVGSYAYHHWAAPPSRMLPQLVAQAMQGTPGVDRIEPVLGGRDYAAYLGGRVVALEEVDRPDGQLVRARLELWLTSANGEELWSKTVVAEGLTQATDVAQVVERMGQLLGDALRVEREDLAAALKRAR